ALEVLVNFVENADSVSPAGEPLELFARRHPLAEGQVRIEVLDRGPGIRLGENPDSISSSDLPGRGLGLEIARSLAAASGGSIGLANRPGGGAVARLDLPAAPAAVETAGT
ncbi:MAG TPA: ATP-binding protein, partial [Thermoanaerobaculia bacterium]|nr:ATP-binding protein [Thermoanaerobaculia bacterium]